MGLINFTNITKIYGQRTLLNNVTFTVEKGERLALIGPNGSGKTTLLRIAMGAEKAELGGARVAKGATAGFLMQDLSTLEGEESAARLGEISALEAKIRALEAEMAKGGDVMREYAKAVARFEAMDGYAIESRLKATLVGLGLRPDALHTPLSQLSSGEKMRAALARILLQSPDVLVLDEPTNHLDIKAVAWLENYLLGFPGAVLVISHDRYFLDRVATRIIELKNATITEFHGNYTNFLAQKAIRTDFLTREAERLRHEIRHEMKVAETLRSHRKIVQAKSREKGADKRREMLEQVRAAKVEGHLGKVTSVGLKLHAQSHESGEIAEARDLTKRFGDRVLFEHVNFLIQGGEHVAFVGSNGCGKTTLLKLLLGEDEAREGYCRVGSWVKVGLLDQNAVFPDESRTMLTEIYQKREMPERDARDILARLGFYGDEVLKTISVLSGGERVRLKLALLLMDEPQLLVLDEPTNHLDLPAREAVENAVSDFEGAVIAVSHDRYFLNQCAERIYAFEGTRIVRYEGNWDAYLAIKNGAAPVIAPPPKPKPKPPQKVPTLDDVPMPPEKPRGKKGKKTVKSIDPRAELEDRIAHLEEKKAYLEAQIAPDAENSLYAELADVMSELDEKYMDWADLDEAEAGDR